MAEAKQYSLLVNLLIGLCFVVAGAFPLLGAFDIGPISSADIHGPPWMGAVAGAVFIFGGLAVWSGERALRFRSLMGVLIFMGLALIGNWIAFGVGDRVCVVGPGDMPTGEGFGVSGLACRIPFAFGALIMDAAMIYGAVWITHKLLGEPSSMSWAVRASGWLMVLVLSPLLLLLFTPLVFKVLFTRVRTGQWPSNQDFIRRQREKGLLRDEQDE